MERNSPMRQEEYDFIALHRVLNPTISRTQLTSLVQTQFGFTMSRKQLTLALEKTIPTIQKLKADDALCLRLAIDCQIIKLGHKVRRIQKLQEIVDAALSNGHEQAAVAAIKLIKEELTAAEESTPDIRVTIGTVKPKTEDEDLDISEQEYAEL